MDNTECRVDAHLRDMEARENVRLTEIQREMMAVQNYIYTLGHRVGSPALNDPTEPIRKP
jgi:hypothetical protein